MACERYSVALNEFAAGGRAADGLDAHLAGCAQCTKDVLVLRQLLAIADEQFKQLSTAEPSISFMAKVRAAATESRNSPSRSIGWLWPALASAAVLVMMFMLPALDRTSMHSTAVVQSVQPRPAGTAITTVATPQLTPDAGPLRATERITPDTLPSRRSARTGLVEPEVLVPAEDSQALMDLIARVHREGLASDALLRAGEPATSLAAPPSIEIMPIEIVPLDLATYRGT